MAGYNEGAQETSVWMIWKNLSDNKAENSPDKFEFLMLVDSEGAMRGQSNQGAQQSDVKCT
eukprot:4893647-Amphidinium_carterae.1